ncbi:MAG: AraC family transcriptional regulator [Pseudomonadales bacterium]|nr:AraC family transcriptional regulator [Pseudomonadales bacterium]
MVNPPLEKQGFSTFSAEYNRVFLNVLQEHGVDLSVWLQNVASEANIMKKTEGFMLCKDIEGFFCRNVETLNVHGLGLAMGKRTDITSHGSLAYAVLSSPNYEEGFRVFQRYLKLRINFLRLTLHFTPDNIQFTFDLTESSTPYISRFYLECAISGTHAFVSQYLKGKKFNAKCEFDYSAPDYTNKYQEYLGSDVRFDSSSCSFTISRSYFDDKDGFKNQSIFSISKQQCETELEQFERAQCIVSKIRTVLYESPWLLPSQEQVADQFSMSIRTLRRKLNEVGTTYQAVLDSVRESLAKEYLKDTNWSIAEIADMTGYSEPSNFKRAFKRWTGHTPNAYRQSCIDQTVEHEAIKNNASPESIL